MLRPAVVNARGTGMPDCDKIIRKTFLFFSFLPHDRARERRETVRGIQLRPSPVTHRSCHNRTTLQPTTRRPLFHFLFLFFFFFFFLLFFSPAPQFSPLSFLCNPQNGQAHCLSRPSQLLWRFNTPRCSSLSPISLQHAFTPQPPSSCGRRLTRGLCHATSNEAIY